MFKKTINYLTKQQRGYALPIVLVILLIGTAMVTPLLHFMGDGNLATKVYEKKMYAFYTADAGVVNGLWQIENDALPEWMDDTWDDSVYDHDSYTYTISDINGYDVSVEIEPIWILEGINTDILGSPLPSGRTPHAEMVVVGDLIGSANGNGLYQISMNYDNSVGNLKVEKIGVWLPKDFYYEDNTCNLGFNPDEYNIRDGRMYVWDYGDPGINYDSLPGPEPDKKEINFEFTPNENPESAFSWIRTNRSDILLSWDSDIKLYKVTGQVVEPSSGDIITTVKSYTSENELVTSSSSVSGDYRAIGNSLMIDSDGGEPQRRDTLLTESDATVSDIPSDAEVITAYLYWSGWYESTSGDVWSDDCSNLSNWTAGADWAVSSSSFMGHDDYAEQDKYITMNDSIDLSSYASGEISVSWQQWEYGNLNNNDGLYFAFSGNGGSTWSSSIMAFRDDIGSSPEDYSYTVPDAYLTNDFKLRFYLDGFAQNGEYCHIDNITIAALLPLTADETCVFEIDGTQVDFDGTGQPRQGFGTGELTADSSQVIDNLSYGNPHGYSYACKKNVTALIRAFSTPDAGGNYPGNGTYTVGDVDATWDADDEWAYAGWSLLIIYRSYSTLGHYIYIYDDFLYCNHQTNLDFDGDGQPGGTIEGFIVPQQIAGETNAAQLTCFVGEGDDYYNGDFIALNAPSNDPPTSISDSYKLWDGTVSGSLNDVWNSQSIGMSADGVDIDTFDVTWASGLLSAGDTSAQIDIYTDADIWNLVYIVLSFRSEVTSSGVMSYNIQ